MLNIKKIVKHDFSNFLKYRFFYMVIIFSSVFALALGFFPNIQYLTFVFISLFIIPIITHSIIFFVEREEKVYIPETTSKIKVYELAIGKLLAALILQLIPLVFYLFIMIFVVQFNFNLWLFALVYIFSVIVHIIIGFSLAILASTHIKMVSIYVAYILIFSFVPFLSLMNLIPVTLDYLFIFSPAYLNAILFENIQYGYLYSDTFYIILAIIIPIAFTVFLYWKVLLPFYNKEIVNKGE